MTTTDPDKLRRVAVLAAQAGKTPAQITRAVVNKVTKDAARARRRLMLGYPPETTPGPAQEETPETTGTTQEKTTDPASVRRRLMLGLKETD